MIKNSNFFFIFLKSSSKDGSNDIRFSVLSTIYKKIAFRPVNSLLLTNHCSYIRLDYVIYIIKSSFKLEKYSDETKYDKGQLSRRIIELNYLIASLVKKTDNLTLNIPFA